MPSCARPASGLGGRHRGGDPVRPAARQPLALPGGPASRRAQAGAYSRLRFAPAAFGRKSSLRSSKSGGRQDGRTSARQLRLVVAPGLASCGRPATHRCRAYGPSPRSSPGRPTLGRVARVATNGPSRPPGAPPAGSGRPALAVLAACRRRHTRLGLGRLTPPRDLHNLAPTPCLPLLFLAATVAGVLSATHHRKPLTGSPPVRVRGRRSRALQNRASGAKTHARIFLTDWPETRPAYTLAIRIGTKENDFHGFKTASGPTIYGYVGGSPLMLTDPLGLAWYNNWNDFTIASMDVAIGGSEFAVGAGDALSFGLASRTAQAVYAANGDAQGAGLIGDSRCSGAYKGGVVAGTALGLASGASALAKSGALYKEIGKKTLSPENWAKYGHLSKEALGRQLVADKGWVRALLPESTGWTLGVKVPWLSPAGSISTIG
ncbi:MAG: hypothetical protein RJA21_1987, partial [Gemmatimonadota bacterium]